MSEFNKATSSRETRNLQPLAAQDKTQLPDAGVEASVRAAPDGSAFGYWQNDQPADGIGMLVVESNSVRRVQHDRIGASFAIPAAAAQYLFAGNGGLLDNRFRTLIPADNNGLAGGQYFFPAIGGGYYIVASAAPRQGEPVGHFMLTLYHLGSNQPLAPLPATEELLTSPPNVFMRGNEFPAFKHVFYLPEKNLLITLPQGSDQLILRRFDLIAALEQYGVDYLFVESTPLVTATPGSDYGYQLVVRSKRGGVTYRLENGPAGMAVSKTGQITWRVPGKPADAQVIVSVRDLSGREIFHSFTITPREN